MEKTKFGSFEDLLDMTEDRLRPIVKRLREFILETHPGAYEVVRLGDRAATYGMGPRKMIEGYAYILPHKSWVNLGFFQGVNLKDMTKIMEGTGKKLRHIKIRTLEDADRSDIKELIRLALEERKKTLGK